MIFLFRKEIKKWNKIWWLVIASLAFGFAGGSFYLLRNPGRETLAIATVNGSSIKLKDFSHAFGEMKSSVDDLAMYWGIPSEQLAKIMGVGNIAQSAMNRCIQGVLLDKICSDLNLHMDDTSFQELLARTMSRAFIDASGQLNVAAYQNYLSRLHMSVKDYEERKELEFKRGAVLRFLKDGIYLPKNVTAGLESTKAERKKFEILLLPKDHFVAKSKETEALTAEKLKAFFDEKKELYRVGKKVVAEYWTVTPEQYKEKVTVDDALIERFYEKNKSSLYRIPPKVKVRSILLKIGVDASPDMVIKLNKMATNIHKKVTAAPETFAEVARKQSMDKETAPKGGLIDFFSRGTHDPEFEKVAFLKLKEVGQISEIFKTKRGYEILKLEDRIASTEKPLASVKDEIVKTLTDKKALMTLKSDLEAVVRTAKEDKTIFAKFAGDNNLKATRTEWISKEETNGYELLNVVAQRIFAGPQGSERGSFVHRGEHVLYNVVEKKESYIPEFSLVKEKVEEDWYRNEGEKLQRAQVKKVKREIMSAGSELDAVAQKYGLKVVKTPMVAADGKVDGLEDAGNLILSSFVLTAPGQVFEYSHDSDSFLVRLLGKEPLEKREDEGASDGLFESEKKRINQRYLDAFLASLRGNATIEIDQKIFKEGALY